MTIDISNLTSEKRAFLKVNPELLKSLEQAIPKQLARMQKRQKRLSKGKSKLQRDLEGIDDKVRDARAKAEQLRREHMMHLPEDLRKLHYTSMKKEFVIGDKQLVCPNCGRTDAKNKRGKKPWCIYCNLPLIPKNKLERWKKMVHFKPLSKQEKKTLKDDFKRRELDF